MAQVAGFLLEIQHVRHKEISSVSTYRVFYLLHFEANLFQESVVLFWFKKKPDVAIIVCICLFCILFLLRLHICYVFLPLYSFLLDDLLGLLLSQTHRKLLPLLQRVRNVR